MRDRDVDWLGTSFEDLRDFPPDAVRDAGYQIRKVQQDREPDDWKPMNTVGPGVREITITEESGEFRVLYVVKIKDWVHVLHCFQKKTRATPQRDIDLAKTRYRRLEATIQAARKKMKKGK